MRSGQGGQTRRETSDGRAGKEFSLYGYGRLLLASHLLIFKHKYFVSTCFENGAP